MAWKRDSVWLMWDVEVFTKRSIFCFPGGSKNSYSFRLQVESRSNGFALRSSTTCLASHYQTKVEAGSSDDTSCCSLFEVSLGLNLSSKAISYHQGDASDKIKQWQFDRHHAQSILGAMVNKSRAQAGELLGEFPLHQSIRRCRKVEPGPRL